MFIIKWIRQVCKYQTGSQKPLVEEGQTNQSPKEKGQKDKEQLTKHYTENWRSSNRNTIKNCVWTGRVSIETYYEWFVAFVVILIQLYKGYTQVYLYI